MTTPDVGPVIIDVSVYQGEIDWKAVAASGDVVGAIIRACDGIIEDPLFTQNIQRAYAAGIPFLGTYQLMRASHTGRELFNALHDIIKDAMAGPLLNLPWSLDVEEHDGHSNERIGDVIYDWIECCDERGVHPMVYTYTSFWNEHVNVETEVPLWLGAYVGHEPVIPKAWRDYDLWQYTNARVVPGVKYPCDASMFHGTIDDLKSFAARGHR